MVNMKIILRLATLMALVTSGTLGAKQRDPQIRRGDLVVMGHLITREYEALDEFGASVTMTADLRISRVLQGHAPSGKVTVRYIAHTDAPENRELRLHLRRSSGGTWLVCKKGRSEGYICR